MFSTQKENLEIWWIINDHWILSTHAHEVNQCFCLTEPLCYIQSRLTWKKKCVPEGFWYCGTSLR